jgi:hypothetical protein
MSLSDSPILLQDELAQIPDQQSLVGTFVSQSSALAQVVVGNALLQVASSVTGLVSGDPVRLERRGGALILIGPTRARSTTGRVTATGTLTTVEYPNGSGVTQQMRRNSLYTPAVNDLVLIDWPSGGTIVGKIDAITATPPPPTPPPPPPQTYDVTFLAGDSGAFQSGFGWRTNDVWGSSNNQGGWFYGSQIRDTIPDSAVIKNAWIFLPLQQQVGNAMFGRHGSESKPGGALSFSSTSNLGNRSGDVEISTSLIDHLKANPGGLGFDYGGYNIWRGTQKDGRSGALRVIYEA